MMTVAVIDGSVMTVTVIDVSFGRRRPRTLGRWRQEREVSVNSIARTLKRARMPLILTGVLGVLGRTSPNDVAAQRETEPAALRREEVPMNRQRQPASMKILFINKGF